MKIVKVVYNNENDFIIPLVNKYKNLYILETFNLDKRKEIKHARIIQSDLGTKNLPLIKVEDENQELIAAIYSETNPDWEKELILKINI